MFKSQRTVYMLVHRNQCVCENCYKDTLSLSLTDAEEQAILREANELGRIMDLNIVRLKFTAYLQDSNGGFSRALKPVVSNPIYDSSEYSPLHLSVLQSWSWVCRLLFQSSTNPYYSTKNILCEYPIPTLGYFYLLLTVINLMRFSLLRVTQCLEPEDLPYG